MVREATLSDIGMIVDVQSQHLLNPVSGCQDSVGDDGFLVGEKSSEEIRRYIDNTARQAYVDMCDGCVRGYALTAPGFTGVKARGVKQLVLDAVSASDSNQVRSLVHIAVRDAYKGEGVADCLYDRVVADTSPSMTYVGEIAEVNHRSQRFFRRHGWTPCGKTYQWPDHDVDWRVWRDS